MGQERTSSSTETVRTSYSSIRPEHASSPRYQVLTFVPGECASHALLSQHHLAPALLARFQNGLLYKFIQGHVCKPSDLAREAVWRGVARRLGEWHAVLPIQADVPIPSQGSVENGRPKSPQEKVGNGHPVTSAANSCLTPGKPTPNIWTVMQKWLRALPAGTDAEKKRNPMLQEGLERLAKDFGGVSSPGKDGVRRSLPDRSLTMSLTTRSSSSPIAIC